MKLNPAVKDLFAFRYEDFTLEGYDPHPAIKAPVAVCHRRLSLIVAMAKNRVIGADDKHSLASPERAQALQEPDDGPPHRHGPQDLRIDRPPAARAHDVVMRHARSRLQGADGAVVAQNLDDAIAAARKDGDERRW